jgi:hypothetical protein
MFTAYKIIEGVALLAALATAIVVSVRTGAWRRPNGNRPG